MEVVNIQNCKRWVQFEWRKNGETETTMYRMTLVCRTQALEIWTQMLLCWGLFGVLCFFAACTYGHISGVEGEGFFHGYLNEFVLQYPALVKTIYAS